MLDLIFFIKISSGLKSKKMKYWILPAIFGDVFYIYHFCLWYFKGLLVYDCVDYESFASLLMYIGTGAIQLFMGVLNIALKKYIVKNMRRNFKNVIKISPSVGDLPKLIKKLYKSIANAGEK